MLDAFIEYLKAQIGQPYLWGGQHTKLTPENYKAVIAKREAKEDDRRRVEAYCEKMFAEGETVLYAYDCSGLGCYWLYNLQHLYRCDVNADTMMHRCNLVEDLPKKGYWLFKRAGSKATHIGYMVSDASLIEAAGRDLGVVERAFRAKDWACWGIPYVFEKEIDIRPVTEQIVTVVGRSVYVRTSDSKRGKILFTAHRGDTFPYISTAPTGWYEILTGKGVGYISGKPQYTKLEAQK